MLNNEGRATIIEDTLQRTERGGSPLRGLREGAELRRKFRNQRSPCSLLERKAVYER